MPEFIYLAETGLIKNFNNGSFVGTLYYQDIKNPIQRVNSVYADTVLNRVFTNAAKGKRLGLELGTNYSPAKWTQLYLGTNVYKSSLSGVILNYPQNVENSAWVWPDTVWPLFAHRSQGGWRVRVRSRAIPRG